MSSIHKDFILRNATSPFQHHFLFILPGGCVGLPVLIWAVRSLHLHLVQSREGTFSTFTILLLFSDAMELLLMPFLTADYFGILPGDSIVHIIVVYISVRLCGFYLHQLVALEGILSLSHPLLYSRLSSPVVSIPLSVTLWMSSFTFDFPELATVLLMFGSGFICIVTVALWVLALKAPHLHLSSSHRDRGPALRVLAVSQFSIFLIHGPSVFLYFAKDILHTPSPDRTVSQIIFFFAGLRLIADPLLYVMVHKGKTQAEP